MKALWNLRIKNPGAGTLKRRMKCGIVKCGRCNIGEKFACVGGPVFSLEELNNICENYM